jgi:4'-phosphopantetheinyl transferase
VAHAALRDVLARYLRYAPAELVFAAGAHGKPFLPAFGLRFNLSHSHDVALIAVAQGREVGVDVEWIDPKFEWKLVAAEFFPPELSATWNQRPPHEARQQFFQHWVRWEAALKCRGTGFGATHLPPAKAAVGLSLFDLDLETGYAGCLALAS